MSTSSLTPGVQRALQQLRQDKRLKRCLDHYREKTPEAARLPSYRPRKPKGENEAPDAQEKDWIYESGRAEGQAALIRYLLGE